MTGAPLLVVVLFAALGATPWTARRAVGELSARRGWRVRGRRDGWRPDGRREGGRPDGGRPDGGRPDGSRPDGGWPGSGWPDGGRTDGGRQDRRRWPLRAAGSIDESDPALLLDLMAVALAAGAPVPDALAAVGACWPGAAGEALVRAARALALGASWDVAWAGSGVGAPGGARAVATALGPAWATGASPVPLLRTAADRARSTRPAATRAAAGRLGVQLVVPLALCYLPAFVLVGLVPVVVSLAAGLLG